LNLDVDRPAAGLSGHRRELLSRMDTGESAARLAFDVYCYRIRRYIGAYAAALGLLDAVVFTAGIGERGAAAAIHADDSAVKLLVVPTNEELAISEQARAVVGHEGQGRPG
jgi:acetate kinase